MVRESWYARVDIKKVLALRPDAVREKKKLAARRPTLAHISAIVFAIADFPAPAGPYIHKIKSLRALPFAIKDMICLKIVFLVWGWHLGASYSSPELWKALGMIFWIKRFQPTSQPQYKYPLSGPLFNNWENRLTVLAECEVCQTGVDMKVGNLCDKGPTMNHWFIRVSKHGDYLVGLCDCFKSICAVFNMLFPSRRCHHASTGQCRRLFFEALNFT